MAGAVAFFASAWAAASAASPAGVSAGTAAATAAAPGSGGRMSAGYGERLNSVRFASMILRVCHFPWIVRIESQDNCGLMRFRIMRISPG